MAKKRSDNVRFEIAFYEGILRYAPDFVEALVCLGDLYTREGFYEKGLGVDERLAQLRPGDPIILYNLACSLSLTGDIPAARRAMMASFESGYDDIEQMAKDPDLANLMADGEFHSLFNDWRARRHLRRPQEAA